MSDEGGRGGYVTRPMNREFVKRTNPGGSKAEWSKMACQKNAYFDTVGRVDF